MGIFEKRLAIYRENSDALRAGQEQIDGALKRVVKKVFGLDQKGDTNWGENEHFQMDFGSNDKAKKGAHPAVMTNDELLAEVTRLSQLLRQYVEFSTEVAKQHDAKIKALDLEIQAIKFLRDFEARMRAEY